jgi:flagellin-like hook-associated protein FlgL
MEAANQFQNFHHSIVNAMQLTNFSFLNSRMDYLDADRSRRLSSTRLSSGEKLSSGSRDLGAIGTEANLRSSRFQLQANRVNTQNFITFLDSQYQSMEQARSIYHQMETLAMRALDPTLTESPSSSSHNNGGGSDLGLMKKEFSELVGELDTILDRKINGQRMFGGKNVNFTEGLQDRNSSNSVPIVTTQDVYTTSGKITLKFATGGQMDEIWILRGRPSDKLSELLKQPADSNNALKEQLRKEFYESGDQEGDKGIFRTGHWATPNNASATDGNGNFYYDTFEINYDSCSAVVDFTPHPVNEAASNPSIPNRKFGTDLFNDGGRNEALEAKPPTSDPKSGKSTEITMIGINVDNDKIYEVEASFTPSLPLNDIAIPWTGETFPAISFGNLDCTDIGTKENARKVLSAIATEFDNLSSAMGQVAATMSRHNGELENMNNHYVANDYAMSRVVDADVAQEATNLATASIKTQMSAQVMSKSTRLKDILIPLTTDHFRSSVLSAKL